MGAGIETDYNHMGHANGCVAPFMGAWIETANFHFDKQEVLSCSLYGSMD